MPGKHVPNSNNALVVLMHARVHAFSLRYQHDATVNVIHRTSCFFFCQCSLSDPCVPVRLWWRFLLLTADGKSVPTGLSYAMQCPTNSEFRDHLKGSLINICSNLTYRYPSVALNQSCHSPFSLSIDISHVQTKFPCWQSCL